MTNREITSKRLDFDEMKQLLDMMNISQRLLINANETGYESTSGITIRKTSLEQLFTITFNMASPAE